MTRWWEWFEQFLDTDPRGPGVMRRWLFFMSMPTHWRLESMLQPASEQRMPLRHDNVRLRGLRATPTTQTR